jgi:hypothetical protein
MSSFTRRAALGSVAILALLTVTRWPLAPKYLYYFDSVNFALALEHFNPALHQPQPPGYPLFVGFARLLHLFVKRPEDVFLLSGILSASGAVLLTWVLGERMFSGSAGILAAALLLMNPVFWLAGLSNQIRLFLALGGVSVALLAWRALQDSSRAGWLYAAFGALGVAAGFRPAASVLLLPLRGMAHVPKGGGVERCGYALLAVGGSLCSRRPTQFHTAAEDRLSSVVVPAGFPFLRLDPHWRP